MKLNLITEEGKIPLTTYHWSPSYWSLYAIATTGRIRSVVSSRNTRRRLSTCTNFEFGIKNWCFGPYSLEIETIKNNNASGVSDLEYVIQQGDPIYPKRLFIDLAWPLGEPQLLIFKSIFDLKPEEYDSVILDAAKNGSVHIGATWMKDFKNGYWPEMLEIIKQHKSAEFFTSDIDGYNELPDDESRKEWAVLHRAQLYGTKVPKWSKLHGRTKYMGQSHWTDEIPEED